MKVYGKNTTTPPTSDKSRQLMGNGLIVVFLIVAFLLTTLGVNAARLQQSVLASTNSNSIALQAYQYAESKIDFLTLRGYKNLTAQAKTEIQDSNYQDEVLLSEESSVDDHKERTATINVYLKGDSWPRASLKLIRSSMEKSTGVPIGTILAWPSHTLPADGGVWLLCNGQSTAGYPQLSAIVGSNVPDYRGVFLRGYGSQTSTHYGTVTHSSAALGELQGDAIRNITGSVGGNMRPTSGSGVFYLISNGPQGNRTSYDGAIFGFDTSRVVPTANEIRPVNRSVNWIIKAA